MKIINWVNLINQFQSNAPTEDILEIIRNDFDEVREGAFDGERVVVRIVEGFRAEIEFGYEIGHFDMKKITNDFNIIRKYNQMEEKLYETVEEIKEILKDNQEALERLDEYIHEQTQFPLFNITFYHKTKIFKAVSRIPYDFVESYLERALENFGIFLAPPKTDPSIQPEAEQ
jgi:hypothetical protein